ncbi:ComEC/Rec2 family competence protein [Paenibacillus wenxiniae]|uniref:ComEC/Rec2 family competence protein n=1 Tax=Paenibacillus wenxiniae TaxID=1636843 RepID=A0ABW4RGY8_9BACL
MTQTRPLVVLCVAWIAGNACAALLSGNSFWYAWSGVVILMLLGGMCLHFLARTSSPRSHLQVPVVIIRSVLLWMIVFIVAAAYWHWNDVCNTSQLPDILGQSRADLIGQQAKVTGVIAGDTDIDGDWVRFPLEVYQLQSVEPATTSVSQDSPDHPYHNVHQDHNEHAIHLPKHEMIIVQLKLAHEQELQLAAGWRRGDQIAVKGSWKEPGVARNFGAFDYRQYLRKQHIHWMMETNGADSLHTVELPLSIGAEYKGKMLRWNDHVRKQLGTQIERIFWAADQGYMKGLLIGDADDIDPASFAAFSRLGLTHILAISGLHIAIYVGLLLWLLRKIGLTKESACLIVMILLPFYVLLTGASPSAIRAGLMGMIGLYLASRGMLKDGLHILCVVGWMMLLYEPYYLLDVSFQLSFAVTAGLIIYVPLVHALLAKVPVRMRSAVAVTLVAQLISFPLTIYYFNQFSLLSFVANFLLVPVSGLLVLPLGTLALAISYVWLPVGIGLGSCVSWLNQWCFWLVDVLDAIPGMLTIWASPELWLILAYYGLLYVALRWMRDIQQWVEQHGDDPLYRSGNRRLPIHSVHPHAHTAHSHSAHSAHLYENNTHAHSAHSHAYTAHSYSHSHTTHSHAHTAYSCEADAVFVRADSLFYVIPFWKLYARRGLHWRVGWTRRRLRSIPALLLSLIILLGYWYHSPHHGSDGIVQFLDIGQGDSILITTPTGKHILVDGGGTVHFQPSGQQWRQRKQPYEVGNKLLVPLLKQRGVHELDAVIATHWDQDHVGGLQAVIEAIPVRQFLFNGTMPDHHQRAEMIQLLLDKKVPMYAPTAGMTMQPDEATRLDFLAPAASSSSSVAAVTAAPLIESAWTATEQQTMPSTLPTSLPVRENQNLYSLVFMLTLHGRHILFTGDADTTEEQSILNELQAQQLQWRPSAKADTKATNSYVGYANAIDPVKHENKLANTKQSVPKHTANTTKSITANNTTHTFNNIANSNISSVIKNNAANSTFTAIDQNNVNQYTTNRSALVPSADATLHVAPFPIPIDVLKVGHHGSKTSTSAAWLHYWQPRLSVISAGVNNRYGHPKQEVLDRLAAVHSAIARTDQQGEIQIRIDSSGHIQMRSMLEEAKFVN